MPNFVRMDEVNGNYTFTCRKAFHPFSTLRWENVQLAYDFAYNMTFGKRGEHRDHRTGGTYKRKNGEIFKDTFQGKLSECALYNVLYKRHQNLSLPSFDVWGLGQWDLDDYVIDGKRASVKSTKAYGQLLLLETRDFDENGIYLPNVQKNGGQYDYFILVRIKPSCESIMRNNRLLYADEADYNILKDLIIKEQWSYDVPGYITRADLVEMINRNLVIHQGDRINSGAKMDASNYYIQAGDLRDINLL